MREVLISIQPKWVEKIVRGEKTVEVRKTKPNCEVPFKCYIYCTKGKPTFTQSAFCDDISNGKVIGEFVCDRIDEFVNLPLSLFSPIGTLEQTCLTAEQIREYLNGKNGYGWHITDLVVYDDPKDLSQVLYRKQAEKCVNRCEHNGMCQYCKEIRPPQSWCYIEPRQTAD